MEGNNVKKSSNVAVASKKKKSNSNGGNEASPTAVRHKRKDTDKVKNAGKVCKSKINKKDFKATCKKGKLLKRSISAQLTKCQNSHVQTRNYKLVHTR